MPRKLQHPHHPSLDPLVKAMEARVVASVHVPAHADPPTVAQYTRFQEGQGLPDFSLTDTHGEKIRLNTLLEHGPVVLTFYRGGWCSASLSYLNELQQAYEEMRSLGADVVAISPQLPAKSREMAQQAELRFKVLSDTNNRVAHRYDLVSTLTDEELRVYERAGIALKKINGSKGLELPVPATFVLDTRKKLRKAFVDPDPQKRCPIPELIALLKVIQREG